MRILILIVISLCFTNLFAQDNDLFFWEAETAMNYDVAENWSFNTSIGKRSRWYELTETGETEVQLAFVEINQFATYRLNPDVKLSAGYKYRWLEPNDEKGLYEHRLTQQISYRHSSEALRLSSRLRIEQRIMTRDFAHRYRYRLAADFPLSGESIDVNEFYLAIANEVLLELMKNENNVWDNRVSGTIGYLLNKKLKLQATLTHRWEDIDRTNRERIFIATGAYFSL